MPRKINKKVVSKQLFGLTALSLAVFASISAFGYVNFGNRSKASVTGLPDRPNVLVFLLDDMDEASLNKMVALKKLPNIEKYLISKGMQFTNSFVTESICCSSRATFLTGKYSHNTHVFNVVGSEGGLNKKFYDEHYKNNLATWLNDAGYFTGHVGKYMNIFSNGTPYAPLNRHYGWDAWHHISSYDTRPGMYRVIVDDDPQPKWPDVYQTKYIGDTVNSLLKSWKQGGKGDRFFFQVTPLAIHVSPHPWTVVQKDFASSIYDPAKPSPHDSSNIILFNTFWHPQEGLKWQITKGSGVVNNAVYSGTYKDGKLLWKNLGPVDYPNTGNLPFVSFNAFVHPDIKNIRQHLVRGNLSLGYEVYSRDRKPDNSFTSWKLDGTATQLFPNTGNKPIVRFAVTHLPQGGVIQHLLRGSAETGYDLYVRARVDGKWTSNEKVEDWWDSNTTDGEIVGFDTRFNDHTNKLEIMIARKTAGDTKVNLYKQVLAPFYRPGGTGGQVFGLTSESGETAFTTSTPTVALDEADMWQGNQATSNRIPGSHLMYSGRGYAEGNWPNVQPHQVYAEDYQDGKLPAGRFRLNSDPNGFDPISTDFKLFSLNKPAFNNPNCGSSHPFLCDNQAAGIPIWPNLTQTTPGGKTYTDYLNRFYLDRLEQLVTIDTMIGSVVKNLESLGVLDDTLIILTSDNGYFLGEHRLTNKMLPYEESIRVPLLIKPPHSILADNSKNTNIVANIDLATTILDYVVGDKWQDPVPYNVDGRSLKPFLSKMFTPWRDALLIEHHYPRDFTYEPTWKFAWGIPDFAAIRTNQNFLYVNYRGYSLNPTIKTFEELYDIGKDGAGQLTNRILTSPSTYSSVLPTLKSRLSQLETCKGAECRLYDKQ